jgi:ATP-dependent helicase IRC3
MQALKDDSHLLLWGCSATLRRNDEIPLGGVFQEIVYNKPFAEMIAEGW